MVDKQCSNVNLSVFYRRVKTISFIVYIFHYKYDASQLRLVALHLSQTDYSCPSGAFPKQEAKWIELHAYAISKNCLHKSPFLVSNLLYLQKKTDQYIILLIEQHRPIFKALRLVVLNLSQTDSSFPSGSLPK